MIVNLESLGLVTRRQHPENARVWLTNLTDEGERAEQAGRAVIDHWSAAIVREIPAEEQEQFVGLLRGRSKAWGTSSSSMASRIATA